MARVVAANIEDPLAGPPSAGSGPLELVGSQRRGFDRERRHELRRADRDRDHDRARRDSGSDRERLRGYRSGRDALWALRELPQPRSQISVGLTNLPSYSASPIPNLPWKRDWATDQGRAVGIEAPPLWVMPQGAYAWKNCPLPGVLRRAARDDLDSSSDLLLAYWFGRRYGVIGPNE
jgi:hypothetical protein